MSIAGDPPVQLTFARERDLAAIARLAELHLPNPIGLTPEDWANRRGRGAPFLANLLIAAIDREGRVVGFTWADAAAVYEQGMAEPWWCLNAVVVSEEHRSKGIGRMLVETVLERARHVGIVSLFGVCEPELAPWYESLGFLVTAPGGALIADPALKYEPAVEYTKYENTDKHGGVMFVKDVEPFPPCRLSVKADSV